MKMKTWLLAMGLVSLVFTTCFGAGETDDKKKLQQLMQRKLKHAQKVLEGVAIKDFEMIGASADELTAVSKEVEFQVLKTPTYEILSNDFRRLAQTLAQQAKDKNLDGAALTYVDLTLNCVKCHKHVREVRMTRNEPPRTSSSDALAAE
jgi:hypothetical protein